MPGRREVLIVGAVGLAAAAAGTLFGPLALQSQSGAADLLSASYPDLSGRPRPIAAWRGTVLVCNFWATWCAPCREEVPLLMDARRKFAANGVEIVGIGIDHAANISQFVVEFKVPYPLLVADMAAIELMRKLGNKSGALPFTVIQNRAGAIAFRRLGILKQPELDQALDAILG
jgi:thiol-disulfide isomerase/thioredoxin